MGISRPPPSPRVAGTQAFKSSSTAFPGRHQGVASEAAGS